MCGIIKRNHEAIKRTVRFTRKKCRCISLTQYIPHSRQLLFQLAIRKNPNHKSAHIEKKEEEEESIRRREKLACMRRNRRRSYFIEILGAAERRTKRVDTGVECGDALAQRVFLAGGARDEGRSRFLQLLGLLRQRRDVDGR